MLSEADNAPSLTPGHFDDWAKRNDYWLVRPVKRGHRPKGVRPAEPLILCGHGVALTVDRDALFIRNGLTHYPQARETHRFFKGDPDLPSRIIMLDGSGSLSFAVLSWLSEQRVALFKLDYRGGLVSILAGRGRAFDSERVQWQIETRADPARRMAFCCDLIGDKLRASVATLRSRIPDTAARATAIETAERLIERLGSHPPDTVAALMMVEARAASAYFRAWRGLPIRWKGLTRHPIPETWRETTARRSYGPGGGSPNRNATHPVNAMLNYAYAVLHSAVQIEAITDGYDPTLGLMHESREDRAALVLDLMERRRPVADATVLKLLNDNVFSGADFVRTAFVDWLRSLLNALWKRHTPRTQIGRPLARLPPTARKWLRRRFAFLRLDKEIRYCDLQPCGEAVKQIDGRIFGLALQSADIGAIHARIEGEPLLRNSTGNANTAQIPRD